MEAPASDPNIQKLLHAEKQAQEIVSAARKMRNEKLKQAKEEAEREIAAYRREREDAYKKKMAEGSSTSDETFSVLQADCNKTINNIMASLPKKKKGVVDELLALALKLEVQS